MTRVAGEYIGEYTGDADWPTDGRRKLLPGGGITGGGGPRDWGENPGEAGVVGALGSRTISGCFGTAGTLGRCGGSAVGVPGTGAMHAGLLGTLKVTSMLPSEQ